MSTGSCVLNLHLCLTVPEILLHGESCQIRANTRLQSHLWVSHLHHQRSFPSLGLTGAIFRRKTPCALYTSSSLTLTFFLPFIFTCFVNNLSLSMSVFGLPCWRLYTLKCNCKAPSWAQKLRTREAVAVNSGYFFSMFTVTKAKEYERNLRQFTVYMWVSIATSQRFVGRWTSPQ